jgi:hypothetical protein
MLPDTTLRKSEKAGATAFCLVQAAAETLQAAFQASKAAWAALLRAPYAMYLIAQKTSAGLIGLFQAR